MLALLFRKNSRSRKRTNDSVEILINKKTFIGSFDLLLLPAR